MIAAIDPGVTGAIAMFYKDGQLAYVHDMPLTRLVGWKHNIADAAGVRHHLEGCSAVVIETIQPRPGNGMAAVAASAASWGVLLGAAPAATVRLVAPQTWTTALGVGSDKDIHRQAAKGLFGGDWFDRKKDDGRADAALIGWWWLTKAVRK